MLNVRSIQQDILNHLRGSIPQEVYEIGVPDADTLKRDSSGKVPYYVAVQFGGPQSKARGRTFAGVTHDDYDLPVYVQVIGPSPETTSNIAFQSVLTALMGYSTDWTSQVGHRFGGSVQPVAQSNSATEAYMVPLSFGVTFQMGPY